MTLTYSIVYWYEERMLGLNLSCLAMLCHLLVYLHAFIFLYLTNRNVLSQPTHTILGSSHSEPLIKSSQSVSLSIRPLSPCLSFASSHDICPVKTIAAQIPSSAPSDPCTGSPRGSVHCPNVRCRSPGPWETWPLVRRIHAQGN